jgi:hypothetical protein
MNALRAAKTSERIAPRRVAAMIVLAFAVAGLWFITPRASLFAWQGKGKKPAAAKKPMATLTSEPEAAQRRAPAKSKRLFIHDKNHVTRKMEGGRMVSNCDECHRIPVAFFTAEKPQGYNVQEFPDHPDCLRCHEHRKDFFKGNSPPICTVCHVSSTPREGNPGLFPKAGGPDVEKDFTGRFPHDKHQDILARNQEPARATPGFHIVKAGFAPPPQDKPAQRWDCRRCHEAYPAEVERILLSNIDWPAAKKAFNVPLTEDAEKVWVVNNNITVKDKDKDVATVSPLLDKSSKLPLGVKANCNDPEKPIGSVDCLDPTAPLGTFKLSPNGPTGHKYCFECHALTQGAWNSPFPRANDCVGCHGLGTALEPPKADGEGIAKTVDPLTLTAAGKSQISNKALLDLNQLLEVPRLPARISYKFQHDSTSSHQIDCASCHVNITRSQKISNANPDVPMSACATCHLNAGGKNINIGGQALSLDEELKRRKSNTQYVCIACHTPETGKNPAPDSHYAVLGSTRFSY